MLGGGSGRVRLEGGVGGVGGSGGGSVVVLGCNTGRNGGDRAYRGGGTCVDQEADYRVPSTVVSREDEGEKEEEVSEERENVETGVGVGSRCRQRVKVEEDDVERGELKEVK